MGVGVDMSTQGRIPGSIIYVVNVLLALILDAPSAAPRGPVAGVREQQTHGGGLATCSFLAREESRSGLQVVDKGVNPHAQCKGKPATNETVFCLTMDLPAI